MELAFLRCSHELVRKLPAYECAAGERHRPETAFRLGPTHEGYPLPIGVQRNRTDVLELGQDVLEDPFRRRPIEAYQVNGWNAQRGILEQRADDEEDGIRPAIH